MREEEAAEIIADLFFAYVNKDEDSPHHFEIEAVKKSVEFLEKNYKGENFSLEWFQARLNELKNLTDY